MGASTMKVQVIDKPLFHIDDDDEDEVLRGFVPEEVALIELDIVPFDFDCFSNLAVNYITRKKGHFRGMSLGSKKSRALPVTDSNSMKKSIWLSI